MRRLAVALVCLVVLATGSAAASTLAVDPGVLQAIDIGDVDICGETTGPCGPAQDVVLVVRTYPVDGNSGNLHGTIRDVGPFLVRAGVPYTISWSSDSGRTCPAAAPAPKGFGTFTTTTWVAHTVCYQFNQGGEPVVTVDGSVLVPGS